MTREERTARMDRIARAKGEASKAKMELITLMDKLTDMGAVKEAEQLERIIIRLEVWQNR